MTLRFITKLDLMIDGIANLQSDLCNFVSWSKGLFRVPDSTQLNSSHLAVGLS